MDRVVLRRLLRYVYLVCLILLALWLLQMVGLMNGIIFKVVIGIAFVMLFRLFVIDFRLLPFKRRTKARSSR